MSLSDVSSLSSAPPTDDEAMADEEPVGITKYFKKQKSETPPPKREPSPPHEYVLADNPSIAFIVMFRARFHDVFPRHVPHYGPQDIERGVEESPPGDYIERLLCALLGLVLNRKKDVERNHYTRPLEEAVQTHAAQWPKEWQGKNPLHGGRTFATLSPEERLQLLKALILWSLSSSEAVQAKIKESYKQARHDDDLNQPLSVQSWGRDSLKRRYWLIEGQDDTNFRLYRESNPALKHITWWSIAGTIPELQAVADKLGEEKGTNSKKLCERIRAAIPRFEASEEKRKRRDYRLARKAAFSRPEPGFSLYEGRTRGKRLKYTYSDDEDLFSDGLPSTRRSNRNVPSADETDGPRFTASGRQIRSRAGGLYGASLHSGQREDSEEDDAPRSQRIRTSLNPNGYSGYNVEDLEDASEAEGNSSGNEWRSGEDEEEENDLEGDDEDEEDVSGDESIINGEPQSLVVQLRYGKENAPKVPVDKPPPPAQDLQTKSITDTGPPGSLSTHLPPIQPPPAPVSAAQYYSETMRQAPMPGMAMHSAPPLHWAPQPAQIMNASSLTPTPPSQEAKPQLPPMTAHLHPVAHPQSFSRPPAMNASAMTPGPPAPHPPSFYGTDSQRPTVVAPSMPSAPMSGPAPLETPKHTQPAESNGVTQAKPAEPGSYYPPGMPPTQSPFFQGGNPPH
ncbi:hypothetical protein N7474_002060 [Penicillium riverlandense]|uniref:uncharacterized protein n=1 Tax=Penicillium riverlandense TaxID=1903569 RepID=UPI002547D7CA|nr:uncharacterized protein N7474_002060 [Penicillium riverlandense]KAJ5833749.1 hypothetical protein N7474_002060 [Penicillium riverlandense]